MCIFAKGAGNTPRLIFTIQRDICETSKTGISRSFGSERGCGLNCKRDQFAGSRCTKKVLTLIARALMCYEKKQSSYCVSQRERERKKESVKESLCQFSVIGLFGILARTCVLAKFYRENKVWLRKKSDSVVKRRRRVKRRNFDARRLSPRAHASRTWLSVSRFS